MIFFHFIPLITFVIPRFNNTDIESLINLINHMTTLQSVNQINNCVQIKLLNFNVKNFIINLHMNDCNVAISTYHP